MITSIGFDSEPYKIIIWTKEGVPFSKTICYSEEELQHALDRHKNGNDIYSTLIPHII